MSDERKTNKRKPLAKYLILAACILVFVAVTVTVIFAANGWFKTDVTIDADGGTVADNTADGENNTADATQDNVADGGSNSADTDAPSGGDAADNTADDGKDKPATSLTEFACPVSNVDVINSFDFGKDATLGHYHFHTGLDMAGEVGASVIACLDGTVESIVENDRLDGTTVTLMHDNGIKTVYSFIDAAEGLKAGDRIKRGDAIGSIAEPTGAEYLQGAHLHFEVYENGILSDPENFLDVSSK